MDLSYRWRILVDYYCKQCGGGFSSSKPDPQFCSHKCYIDYAREEMADRARALWGCPEFRSKIQSARQAAGYPDTNRPEAVAKRKMRTACKNWIRRSLFPKNGACSSTILGYTANELKVYIESKFQEGMSWLNYGDWEVDHIFPVSRFPIGTPVAVVNALENLQPLWTPENRRKGNQVPV